MKIIISLGILMLSLIGTKPQPQTRVIIDDNLFKKELQESVLEFCADAGINPDSVYMPFKDEL